MVDSAACNYSSKERFSMGKTQVFMLLRLQLESGKIHTQIYMKVPFVGLKKHYETQIEKASLKNKSPKKVILNKLQRHPCLIGNKIDPLVQKYLKPTRSQGGVVNTSVTIATANVLVKQTHY